jgi:hypothetical protein
MRMVFNVKNKMNKIERIELKWKVRNKKLVLKKILIMKIMDEIKKGK